MNGFVRFAQRSNVTSASRAGSYTQRDIAGQMFFRMTTSAQVFARVTTTHTADEAGGGSTYWEAGGGAQLQVVRQGLWLRTEGTISRNADLLTQAFVPRESLSIGFNGYVTSRTSVGVDVYLDRATTSLAGWEPVGDAIASARDPNAANGFAIHGLWLGAVPLGPGTSGRDRQRDGVRGLERERPAGS